MIKFEKNLNKNFSSLRILIFIIILFVGVWVVGIILCFVMVILTSGHLR